MLISLSGNFATNQSNPDFLTFSLSAIKKCIISQLLKVVGLLGEKCNFYSLGILIEKDLNYFNTRIKLQSFGALIRYLNHENLTHDGKTKTIKKFLNRIHNRTVPTHLDSLARFDSESKWAWPKLTQAQLDSFWPNLTLLSPSQNGPGPTSLLLAQFDPTLCFFLAV